MTKNMPSEDNLSLKNHTKILESRRDALVRGRMSYGRAYNVSAVMMVFSFSTALRIKGFPNLSTLSEP